MIFYTKISNAYALLRKSFEKNSKEKFTQQKCCDLLYEKGVEITQPGLWRILNGSNAYVNRIESIWRGMKDVLDDYGQKYDNDSEDFIQTGVFEAEEPFFQTPNIPQEGIQKFRRAGILGVSDQFHIEKYLKRIEEAEKKVWILQTFLSNMHLFINPLIDAAKRGVEINILLTHPYGHATHLREKSLNINVRENILSNLHYFIKEEVLRDNVKIRLYDRLPGLNIFGTDNSAYVGTFWEQKASVTGGFLQTGYEGRGYFDDVLNQFNRIWEIAIPCPLNTNFHILKESLSIGASFPSTHTDLSSLMTGQDGDNFTFYRCYYLQDDSPKWMDLIINSHSLQARLTNTPSNEDYFGFLQSIASNSVVDLKTSDQDQPRVARIIIQGNSHVLPHKDWLTAVFANIHPIGYPECGPMLLQKISAQDLKEKKFIPASIVQALRTLPLQAKFAAAGTLGDLEKSLRIYFPEEPLQHDILQVIHGEYTFYSINPVTQKIIRGFFKIGKDGDVSFRHYHSVTNAGNLSVIDRNHILITNREAPYRVAKYFNILKVIQENGRIYLKGCYTGLSHTNHPTGGRIYAMKSEKPVYLTGEISSFRHGGKKHQNIKAELPDFDDFFSGKQDNYIEDSSILSTSPNLIRLDEGDSLDYYAGTYILYLKSLNTGNVRRCVIDIGADGRVKFKGKLRLNGTAVRYGHLLQIRIFEETHRGKRLFDFIQCWVPNQLKPKNFLGISSSVSRAGMAFSRRMIIFPSKNKFPEEETHLLDWNDAQIKDIDRQYPGFIQYIMSEENGFIKIPKDANLTEFPTSIEHAERAFFAACYMAKKGKYEKALSEIEQALQLGFNDINLLEDELSDAGYLADLKEKIIELIKRESSIILQ